MSGQEGRENQQEEVEKKRRDEDVENQGITKKRQGERRKDGEIGQNSKGKEPSHERVGGYMTIEGDKTIGPLRKGGKEGGSCIVLDVV